MTSSTTFEVRGTVRGKHRPRFSRGHAYKDARDREWEKMVAEAYTMSGGTLHEGPVEVEIHTYRKIPKSRPKKVVRERDVFKPDFDNIEKGVLDALNGVAFTDDRFVVMARTVKHDRTRRKDELLVVTVREIQNGNAV